MSTEQLRADFEAWITASPYEKPVNLNPDSSGFPGQYRAYEVQLAWEAYQAGRAALQSQDRGGYAGVTVWAGGWQYTNIITKIQYETSNVDELLERFEAARDAIDRARRIEGEGK